MTPAYVSLATRRSVSVRDRGSRRPWSVAVDGADRLEECVGVLGRVVMSLGGAPWLICGGAGDSAAVHPFATHSVAWSLSASAGGLNQVFGRALVVSGGHSVSERAPC
jgi:hypothetical protein